ncbi:predicted protein [Chaetomium globosum CBS 148.51]|uniref:Uncharacterized protein n=1 Tax=Chaetomium globosum (strain ATCC 6205 / CBS 148.51 / DSM 1962 / NBRC 6347 / NRRL 1970) TaxID=306901 RepID=Q2H2R4_CHAGB|nr:uncharacterized protein CHGG_03932 [Chaetomium globosum CBS 148.51]EAQ87313.1 predicted protein [Chaetomium globosum CBS 148.51]
MSRLWTSDREISRRVLSGGQVARQTAGSRTQRPPTRQKAAPHPKRSNSSVWTRRAFTAGPESTQAFRGLPFEDSPTTATVAATATVEGLDPHFTTVVLVGKLHYQIAGMAT